MMDMAHTIDHTESDRPTMALYEDRVMLSYKMKMTNTQSSKGPAVHSVLP